MDLQVFRNNMSVKEEPVIKACKASDNWTCVTFKPDLAKFGMSILEEQTVSLMRKRVHDLAGVLGKTVKVRCFAHELPIKKCQRSSVHTCTRSLNSTGIVVLHSSKHPNIIK